MQTFQRILLATSLLIGSSFQPGFAQSSGEPAKLTKMRSIYEQEIVKLKLPILQKLANDLGSLEQQLTKENKLEEAVKARGERLGIEATIEALGSKLGARKPTTNATNATNPTRTPSKPAAGMKEFSVQMGNASIQGSLKRAGSAITNWTSTTCQATWSGGQLIPGLYDVYIDFDTYYYRGGGQLKFEELNQDFLYTVPPTTTRTVKKVGTFKLGSALGFTIKANSKNRWGILRLYGITFKPSAQQ